MAQDISIRLPWKDNGYSGLFCDKPCYNNSCGNDIRKLLSLLKIMEPKHMEAFLDYAKKVTRYGDL